MPDKFKHNDNGFKYFIGYKEGENFKPLCIILPEMTGYWKYFENEGKKKMINAMMMCVINAMKFGTRSKLY